MPQTDWEWQTEEEGFDKNSFKRCSTAEWLEHRLPHRQPNPHDSPGSNRKHLFTSDNSIGCLWGASLWDIKRIREEEEERKRDQSSDIDRTRKGKARVRERDTQRWRHTKTQPNKETIRHCKIVREWVLFCYSTFRGSDSSSPVITQCKEEEQSKKE